MNNQEYLDKMTPEQRQRSRIDGQVGILSLYADYIREGEIIVNPDTLNDDGKTFSFSYMKKT